MDWTHIYSDLISHARQHPPTGYTEKHHIVPKCLGGSDARSNLVRLSARQHLVAHKLLVRLHPDNPKLAFALWAMYRPTGQRNFALRTLEVARLRERNAEAIRAHWDTPGFRDLARKVRRAQWAKPAHRERMRQIHRSLREGPDSVYRSEETRAKHRESTRELWTRPEYRERQSEARRTVWTDPDVRQRHSTGATRSWDDPDIREKRMRAHRAVTQTEEYRAKFSKTWVVTHIATGRSAVVRNLTRWCNEHRVNSGNLIQVARGGRAKSANGYTARYATDADLVAG